jgi:hypothetical protein
MVYKKNSDNVVTVIVNFRFNFKGMEIDHLIRNQQVCGSIPHVGSK